VLTCALRRKNRGIAPHADIIVIRSRALRLQHDGMSLYADVAETPCYPA
jgi:hypothetical protein